MLSKSCCVNEYAAFTVLVDRLLAVPHVEIQRRMDRYRKQADKNPRKRGPKRKGVTPSAGNRDAD
jgi:hypothetical protein